MSELGFHYREDGARNRASVVLLHAFPLHSEMWQPQIDALNDVAHLVSFDVRGLGRSPLPQFPSMLDHVVDDLLALLDHLKIPRALLCGLSMGGYVALRAIERDASRVSGLLLADTQAGADTNEAKLKRADGIRKISNEGLVPYVDAFLKNAMSAKTHAEQPDVVARARSMMLDASPDAVAHALVTIATRTDTSAVLSKINVPTRVIVGEDDTITPPAIVREMAQKIPGADLHVLHNAGHLANLEAPAAFNHLLLDHIKRVADKSA